MSWLNDSVFAIRESATQNLKKLTEVFGVDWAQQHIVPKILALSSHQNYLHRMTTLFAITVRLFCIVYTFSQALAPVVGADVISNTFSPLVLKMAQDPVANVRFNVAKTLEVLIPYLDAASVSGRIRPVLAKLAEDLDRDVRYFAGQALAKCEV